ncbi:MAG: hypothetical protein CMF52_07365 [Legionellales bacterium]|nr:hypothetical protein [Legionellales bacterium]
MAYNSSKGPQTHGDVKYEGDAEDTQIDFENDYIALKTNGIQRFIVNSNAITSSVALTCSLAITASHFVGDGSGLTGLSSAAISTYSNAADNRVITSVDASTVQGEANLTFDGSLLNIAGDVSGSGVLSIEEIKCSGSVIAASFTGDGSGLTGLSSAAIANYNNASDNRVITSVDSDTVQGEANLTFDGSVLNITGDVSGSGVLSIDQIKCSGSVAAASFVGDGSNLTNLPSAAITTYNTSGDNRIITSVNSTTVQGESRLTFDGSLLYLSGTMKMQDNHPSLEFSNSAGTGLGTIGYNSANNILIQNDSQNKNIVFKTSDNGVIKEGLRIDGAVPEVVVNQSSDSLINFRVESDNNTHMIFVDGSNDKVGINTDTPSHPLSVIGHVSASLGITGSALHVGNFATVIDSNISGSGVLSIEQIKCSGSVSAVSFVGDGSNLTNLPSAAITTYNTSGDNRIITSVNSTTVQGESGLTFDGETLNLTGDLTASAGISSPHIVSTGHISASSGVTGSQLHAGGVSVSDGAITMRTSTGSPSKIELYCEVSNAHKVTLKAPPHAQYSGDVNFVLPPTEGTNGQALITDGSGVTSWSSVGGGGGSPGGSDSQIQYNNGGSFGGEANFVYDDSNDRVGIGNSAPTHTLSVTGAVGFTGDLTVTGTIRATKIIDVTRHYFSYGGTGTTFIPHGEGSSDDATTAVTKTQFVAAYSGRLKRVVVRPKNAQNGHVTASIYVAGDGVEDFAAGGSIIQHVTQSMGGAAVHANINFSGSTTQFSAGEIVGVAIDFKNNPGDTNVTCIWEYNSTEDVLS